MLLAINSLVFQWGIINIANSYYTINLPITLTTKILAVTLQNYGGNTSYYTIDSVYNDNISSFIADFRRGSQYVISPQTSWIVIGF